MPGRYFLEEQLRRCIFFVEVKKQLEALDRPTPELVRLYKSGDETVSSTNYESSIG